MSDSPDPVPDAKPLRMTFAILAVAATLFALGWALLREHPIPAVILIVGSVLYLLYELFTSEVLVRNVPGMLRFLAAVMIP